MRGQAAEVMGRVAMQNATSAVDSGKRISTGVWTDGCPSHGRAFNFVWNFSENETSPKYERVGDADIGRMDESSVFARLWRGVDGVEGKFKSADTHNEWFHRESMDASFDRGVDLSASRGEHGEGMEMERGEDLLRCVMLGERARDEWVRGGNRRESWSVDAHTRQGSSMDGHWTR